MGISIRVDTVESAIHQIRGQRVMLDADLAEMYCVPTKRLNQQVRRNIDRFPSDFMFQLSEKEFADLRLQFVTSNGKRRGGRHYLPYVFTEQGVAMLSSVLRSQRAVQVNIAIMRAFVRLREMVGRDSGFAVKLEELERKLASHDADIRTVFEAIRTLMKPERTPEKRPIGF